MANGYTIFTSYVLAPTGTTSGYTYSQGIHCNYINSLQLNTETPATNEINLHFSGGISDFKFLSNNINNGTGFTAYEIYAIIQLVNNSGYTNVSDVKPISSNWKLYRLTNQISGHVNGNIITPTQLQNTIFKISLSGYTNLVTYKLDYLNYPVVGEKSNLSLGDEIYFFGNVKSDIKADVYTTDLSINLSLNEFNSTTNKTWDGISSVSISEVGIYDINKNLVAIGKLNNPVLKDSTISRTIVFDIDF